MFLYIFVCLICNTLHNLHCFTSIFSFQCRLMKLCCNSPILNFQLVFSLALHVQWTMCKLVIVHFLWSFWQAPPTLLRNQTVIENPGFPLVGSTKVTIGLARIKVHVQPETYKSQVLAPKFSFWTLLLWETQPMPPASGLVSRMIQWFTVLLLQWQRLVNPKVTMMSWLWKMTLETSWRLGP